MNGGAGMAGGMNGGNMGGNNMRGGSFNNDFPALADPSIRNSILSTLESHHMLNARNQGSLPRN